MEFGQTVGTAVGIATIWAILRESKKSGVRIDIVGQVNDPTRGAGVKYNIVTPEFFVNDIKYFSDLTLTKDTQGKYDIYADADGSYIYISVKNAANDKTLAEINVNKTAAVGAKIGLTDEERWNKCVDSCLFGKSDADTAARVRCVNGCSALLANFEGLQTTALLPRITRSGFSTTAVQKARVFQKEGWKRPIYRVIR